MQHRDRVAHIRSRPHRRIDTHVAHRTHDHDLFNSLGVELLPEVGVAKGVDIVLDDHRLAVRRRDRWLDLHPLTAGNEHRCFAMEELVANVKDRHPCGTRIRDHTGRIGGSGLDTGQRQLTGGQILFLQIDNDQTALFHDLLLMTGFMNRIIVEKCRADQWHW